MKAAFFDIDGVVTRGFFVEKFWAHLAKKGLISQNFMKKNNRHMQKYRRGEINYLEMMDGMNVVALAHKGARQSAVRSEARKFLSKYKPETFDYTDPLIAMLKRKGFKVIAISGSNIELTENYIDVLGFDKVYGTEFEVDDDVYTGEVKLHLGLKEAKGRIMEQLSFYNCVIGFGDSSQDVGILENVEIPIALNPHKELETEARKHDWTILRDGDDIIGHVSQLLEVLR